MALLLLAPDAAHALDANRFASAAVGCSCQDWTCWNRVVRETSTSSFVCAATALMAAAGIKFPTNLAVTIARCVEENAGEAWIILGRVGECTRQTEPRSFVSCLLPVRGKIELASSVMSCIQGTELARLNGAMTALSCGITLAQGATVLTAQGTCLYRDVRNLLDSERALEARCANYRGYVSCNHACRNRPDDIRRYWLRDCEADAPALDAMLDAASVGIGRYCFDTFCAAGRRGRVSSQSQCGVFNQEFVRYQERFCGAGAEPRRAPAANQGNENHGVGARR